MQLPSQHLYCAHLQLQRERMNAALESAGCDAVAIYSGRLHWQFLDDQAYPFKVNPHFKSWVPLLDAPESWLLYAPAQRPKLVLYQPRDYWHKAPETPTAPWTTDFDIEVIREPADAKRFFPFGKRCALIGEITQEIAAWSDAAGNPKALLDHLHYQRAYKTDYEIACMRVASRRAARGHLAASNAFNAGASEYEIHLAYLHATGHSEEELPYPNIIALNSNAAVLHYQHLNRTPPQPQARHSFLIDAGAAVAGYAADVTRTYSAADDEFAALILKVHELQQTLCRQVRAGTSYIDIHLAAHRLIAHALLDFGVITASPEAATTSGLSSVFFPHGVGHLLGLQVHDVAGFAKNTRGDEIPKPQGHPYLRLTRTLEQGFVVTIEPGIYFIDLLLEEAAQTFKREIVWSKVEQLKKYGGIRIEDNVVCTTSEPVNLTREEFAAEESPH